MSISKELAEASGSNSISDQIILFIQRQIAEDLEDIEEMREFCQKINDNVWNMPELPASEEDLAFLRMLQYHDHLERAKTIRRWMQMINETEAVIRIKTGLIEMLKNM
ncbi:hypothetical protein CTI12_AA244490 [Artemisia annua]|uniref:Uncharacterized protein n=1 Tax=Artemisia annua TaxID=35608 RepID=A0A2U1NIH5_ARTAN|nr:hypothetical protein CTI12_AA244490 [Artemisia annua]